MTGKIRILMVTTGFLVEAQSGGIGRFTTELCQALNKEVFEPILCGVWYYGTAYEDDRMAQLRAAGVETFIATPWNKRAGYWNVIRAYQGLYAWVKQHMIDIIHSHTEFGDLPAALVGRICRVPVTMRTLHNHEWKRRPYLRPLASLLYPLLFHIEIGVGQHVVDGLNNRRLARVLSREAIYLNEAIDLKRQYRVRVDREQKRSSLGIPAERLVVGSVGRLSQQKGYSFLLEAARLVLQEMPDIYFLLIGSGELEADLKEQARALGLETRVIFTGSRNDVEELLQCMDLFVSSSLWEGMPIVLLESMAAGIPIVATDIPGTCELIQDKVNGWLAPACNSQALAAAIGAALRNPGERKQYIWQSHEKVKIYSIDKVATEYQTIYLRALHRDKVI